MYEAYWGLRMRPFDNTADPRFFFGSKLHADAFAQLLYVSQHRCGGAILHGRAGVGKSLLARALASGLPHDTYQVAFANAPFMGPLDTLLAVLSALGDQDIPRTADEVTKEALSHALDRRLAAAQKAGRHPVILLDDADLLEGDDSLEMCRYLMGLTDGDGARLSLILIGNPTLAERVNTDKHRKLDTRLRVKCQLEPLSGEQTKSYILHRLQTAGSRRGLFTAEAADKIVQVSEGIPAQINRLCDLSLLMGYGLGLDRVLPEVVNLVIEQLESEPVLSHAMDGA